jgi:hypothetical protein
MIAQDTKEHYFELRKNLVFGAKCTRNSITSTVHFCRQSKPILCSAGESLPFQHPLSPRHSYVRRITLFITRLIPARLTRGFLAGRSPIDPQPRSAKHSGVV